MAKRKKGTVAGEAATVPMIWGVVSDVRKRPLCMVSITDNNTVEGAADVLRCFTAPGNIQFQLGTIRKSVPSNTAEASGQHCPTQGDTAGKGILRDLRDGVIQCNILQLTAVGKGIFADACGAAQCHTFQRRSMVGVDVVAITADCGNGHAVIQADVINIAGEGIVSNHSRLAQIDILQADIVVESHFADLSIFAQCDRFQGCRIVKGIPEG